MGLALVVPNHNEEILREVYHWMVDRLSPYKMPSAWYLLDAIPKTSRGKTNRTSIAKLCAELKPSGYLPKTAE